jgi:hypothetical protein
MLGLTAWKTEGISGSPIVWVAIDSSEHVVKATAWDEDSTSDPDCRDLTSLNARVEAGEADSEAFCGLACRVGVGDVSCHCGPPGSWVVRFRGLAFVERYGYRVPQPFATE